MKDTIYHNTHHTFSIADRLRLLLGKRLTIKSEIHTDHETVRLTGKETCISYVDKIFPLKIKS